MKWAICAISAAVFTSASLAPAAVADVVGDGIVEQHRILRHHADRRAQALLRDLAHVLAIDGDRAALDVVEPIEQPRHRRLAGAGRPDDRDRLAGRHLEGDTLQDRPRRIIGEVHVLEGDGTLADANALASGASDLGLHLEQIEHLLDIGQTLADFAVDEADEVQRHGELHQHGVDEDEVADGLLAALHGQRRDISMTVVPRPKITPWPKFSQPSDVQTLVAAFS
jgi:hypothetical protein